MNFQFIRFSPTKVSFYFDIIVLKTKNNHRFYDLTYFQYKKQEIMFKVRHLNEKKLWYKAGTGCIDTASFSK